MSEVEVLPPPSPLRMENVGTTAGEDGAENVDEEAEAQHVKTEITLEDQPIEEATPEEERSVQQADEEKSAQPAEEDRTEDQVPDITGTENVDPMTTSMDGIEELPANEEEQNVDIPEAEPAEAVEEQKDVAADSEEVVHEDEGKENEQVDGHAEQEEPVTEPEEAQQQEEKAASPQPEALDEAAHEEAPQEATENEAADAVEATDEAATELAEPEEPPKDEGADAVQSEVPEEAPAATEAQLEEKPEEEQGGFELQAPPTPKRPRTPNDLDNVEPAGEEQHAEQQDDVVLSEVKSPQVATPTSKVESKPETPATPKTPKSSRKTSSTAGAAMTNGSIPGTPKSAALSMSEEPQPATPRSGAIAPRADAIEEKIVEDESKPEEATAEPETVPEPESVTEEEPEAKKEQGEEEKPVKEADDAPESEEIPLEKLDTTQLEGHDDVEAAVEEEKTEAHVDEEPVEVERGEERVDIADESERHIVEAKVEPSETTPPPRARRVASPSPPPRRAERSPSPVRRQRSPPSSRNYTSYDQDSHRTKGAPPRLPAYSSFSSYTPAEKSAYSPISPWVQNAQNKYRNEYTAISSYRPPSTYTSQFDDIVNTGAFSTSLYSANRLLERSRSRTRERKNAMRSQRSASNYYRYTSSYGTAPIRSRDYSTPPLSAVNRPPSRSGSFISFMEYSGAKQYEMARSRSRSAAAYDSSPLSRSSSRSNTDLYLGAGRLSRVDSYVHDLNHRYEWEVPSTYSQYRSSSRSYLPQDYTPVNGYTSYNNSTYISTDTTQRMKRYARDVAPSVRSMYEKPINASPYTSVRSPSSNTLSRLYSGFTRDWTSRA